GFARIWDAVTLQERAALSVGYWLALAPDGQALAAAKARLAMQLWDLTTLEKKACVGDHDCRVQAAAFSPDGPLLAHGAALGRTGQHATSADLEALVYVWDVASGRLRWAFPGHTDTVRALAFSPDGRTLASASQDRTVKLWDVASGRKEPIAILT